MFGSREIAGIADQTVTAAILTSSPLLAGDAPIPGLQSWISGLYAFDMLINNIDRHDHNYISVDVGGTRRFFAIDFGRALSFAVPIEQFQLDSHATRSTFRLIRQRHGFDLSAALAILDRILGLSSTCILDIASRMPIEWNPENTILKLSAWWSSEGLKDKIARLRKGLRDGSLL